MSHSPPAHPLPATYTSKPRAKKGRNSWARSAYGDDAPSPESPRDEDAERDKDELAKAAASHRRIQSCQNCRVKSEFSSPRSRRWQASGDCEGRTDWA